MSTRSTLEIFDTAAMTRTAVHEWDHIIEAPNWLNDGDTILYNADGHIFRYSLSTGADEMLETGICQRCNNDHVPSPDNTRLAVSCSLDPENGWASHIFILPISGGTPRQVTVHSPSFLHGWSSLGDLTYCAFRKDASGEQTVDIYTIPENGGAETRLTDGIGYNDGPEYTPDGQQIWFNSTRSGLMQAYRMNRDGSGLTQMTHTDSNVWFPHVSPDGTKVVYLVFHKGDLEPWQHLPDKHVELWLMSTDGSNPVLLTDLFGGQGTINVNSWAPDSRRFAFISYR